MSKAYALTVRQKEKAALGRDLTMEVRVGVWNVLLFSGKEHCVQWKVVKKRGLPRLYSACIHPCS
jgi:hypothetical protein